MAVRWNHDRRRNLAFEQPCRAANFWLQPDFRRLLLIVKKRRACPKAGCSQNCRPTRRHTAVSECLYPGVGRAILPAAGLFVGQQEPPKRAAAGLIARLSLALACYVRLRTTRANQLCQQVDGVVDRDDVGDHQRRSAVNVDRVEIGPFIGEKLHHFADFRLR
jgi:hypothetical protein